MLAVLAVLAAVAVAVGRLCFGRRMLGQAGGNHDLEAWVERTCGPCVGASIFSAAPVPGGGGPSKEGDGTAVAEGSAASADAPPREGTERGDGSMALLVAGAETTPSQVGDRPVILPTDRFAAIRRR
ncbi:hypothetical protein GUJ93_ZPchr0001g33051 [Zizania palustris]|uniref:Secreted protein n=1 Tax=Zizania palustris TaxID=103762 RepID=A0A8J5RPU2_ZIZPA|nr:hypothetical protein GUJ93_ZPchr0001g33051 [Zizania palustris]